MKKNLLPLFLFSLLLGSCRKENVESQLPPAGNTVTPVQPDYRDSVTGTYIGTLHHTVVDMTDTSLVFDTIYTDTAIVSKTTSTPNIITVAYYSCHNYALDPADYSYTKSGGPQSVGAGGQFSGVGTDTVRIQHLENSSLSPYSSGWSFTGVRY